MRPKQIVSDLLLFLIIITLIVIPWQLYIHISFPIEAAWESSYNRKHIFEVLGSHGHPFYYHFDKMRIIFGELVYLPLIWLIYRTFKEKFDEKKLILLIWILIPYIFFSIAKTKMQGYILCAAPAIFIMIGVYFKHLQSIQSKQKFLIKTICILLLVLPIRYSIERIKPFSKKQRNVELISKMQYLDNKDSNNLKIIFNCKYPVETMFHTDIIAYEIIPDKEKLMELSSKDVTIYIDNGNKIPLEKLNLKFVNYVKITGQNKD
jgi:4-amino-4-deoxy-L-arabinose transferase